MLPPAVLDLARRLAELGAVRDLFVAGSLATGDHRPGVSDLDLVAVVEQPRDRALLTRLHRRLDLEHGVESRLGCVYVDESRLLDREALHPTWTHGRMVDGTLSGICRAELVSTGLTVFGRSPGEVLPPMTVEDVREAARQEVLGYWRWAVRRPWVWLDPGIADLGLTSMARARHTLATGELLTKTRAVEAAHCPDWLRDQLRARRQGGPATSPRLRTAAYAWRDARRTVATAHRHIV